MSQKIFFRLLIFTSVIFTGCNKCGNDVNLGNFKLIPASIEGWFPYKEVNELRFKNTEGEIMIMQNEEREEEMLRQVNREICWKSNFDYALELFWGEYLYVNYQGKYSDTDYSISLSLQVVEIYYNDGSTALRLKDLASYSFDMYNNSGFLFGGIYIYTVDYRGNAIPVENPDSCIPEFLNMVDINGNTYYGVWYFSMENAPSFYFQEGQGIIAFQGLNDEVWVLQ